MKSPARIHKILGTFALVACLLPCLAFAQDTAAPAAASSSTAWYLSTEFFAALIAFVTGGIAVWQNKEKKTAEKVSATLVVAIEAASKIPAVAEGEKQLKAKIKEVTTKAGVEPVVNKLVNLLT